jgi:hypothetical protein
MKRILVQFAHNLTILKVRTLACVEVPLLPDEESVALRDDRDALDRLGGISLESLRLVEDLLRRSSFEAAEGRVMDSVNSLFRFTFEELSLRWHACSDAREAKVAPQKTLTAAVDFQRRLADTATDARRALEVKNGRLGDELTEAKRRIEHLQREKKEDFDAYIKEVCVLKEQLFRSYKDKDYVGKPVDMLRLVLDEDTGDDVSVDELLRCRRMMRAHEQETAALKERINSLSADVSNKARFIKRLEERNRAAETMVAAMQSDVEQLNGVVSRQDRLLALAKDELRVARAAKAVLEQAERDRRAKLADGESQTPEVETPMSKYDIGAEQIPDVYRERSRFGLFSMYAERVAAVDALKAEHESFAKEGSLKLQALEGQVAALHEAQEGVRAELHSTQARLAASLAELAALQAEMVDMRERVAAAEEAERQAREERDDAVEAKRLAEERAADAVLRCATHSQQVAAELAAGVKALDIAQRRNAALCQAFLNVSERLEEIKTRAGLKDYKRRANEFHFKRAETAIKQAKEEMRKHEEACKAREAAAVQRVAHAQHHLRMVSEDLRETQRTHAEEIKALTERTKAVQDAFEALLQDFNRLRDDYLKTASGAANDYLKARNGAGGVPPDQAAKVEEEPGHQQRFIFEEKSGISNGDAALLQMVRFVMTLTEAREKAPVAVREAAKGDEGDGAPLDDATAVEVNTAVVTLADFAARTFARHLASLHRVFTEVEQMDAFIAKREKMLDTATTSAPATTAKGKLHAGGNPGSRKGSAKPQRRSLAAEHAKFLATRDVEAERVGLQQQRVMNAWVKVRLFQQLDSDTRDVIASVHKAYVDSRLDKPAPLQLPEQLAELQPNVSSTASPTVPALTPIKQSPGQGMPTTSASFENSPSEEMSLKRSVSKKGLPPLVGSQAMADDSAGLAAALPTNDALLNVQRPPRRRVSLGDPAMRESAMARHVPRWGAGLTLPPVQGPPEATKADLSSHSGINERTPMGALTAEPLIPEVRLRSPEPASRPHTTASAVMADSLFGDYATVEEELELLRRRIGHATTVSDVPAWQRQKARLRDAQRTAQSPHASLPPTRTSHSRTRK